MNTLLTTLTERGFVHDVTPHLGDHPQPLTGYVGFDPTASSLHVGSLVPVMGLAWLQRLGGRPIALVGGGTGMVGDPSGKRSERPVLDVDEIDTNSAALQAQLERFLDFTGDRAASVMNNADWLRPISLMEFLRDTGKHFTIGYMLQKESVRSRLEAGISFTEFSYMLVQAYDFYHLYTTAECALQMGGSDQWGNITAGIELIGRRTKGTAHGLVFPLLTTSSGSKFGKTEAGNIWLDPTRTSPYQFYQFWLNTEDADVERYLRFFTFLALDEIAEVVTTHRTSPGARSAQRCLARAVTAMVHRSEVVPSIEAASSALFGGQTIGDLTQATLDIIADEVPCTPIPRRETLGQPIAETLIAAGLATSKGEARRGIDGRGFSLNGIPLDSVDRVVQEKDIRGGHYLLLRKGKKRWAALRLT